MNTEIETTLQSAVLKFTPVGIVINEGTQLETWASIGGELYRAGDKMKWWLADWAAFGERNYGELAEWCQVNGVDYGALRVYAYVASHVQLLMRINTLTFSHHQIVAGLNPKEQKKWLAIAESEKLTVSELRKRIIQNASGEKEKAVTNLPMIEIQKFFLDADVFLERNLPVVMEEHDFLWAMAAPMMEKAAKIWPEKVSLK
jgi:hypothetical protein